MNAIDRYFAKVSPADEAVVLRAQLQTLARHGSLFALAGIVCLSGLVLAFPHIILQPLNIALVGAFVANVAVLAGCSRLGRTGGEVRHRRIYNMVCLLLMTAGSLWGVISWQVMQGAAPVDRLVPVVALVALSGGSLLTLFAAPGAVIACTVLAAIPVNIALLQAGGPPDMAVTLMGAGLGAVMILAEVSFFRGFVEATLARRHNADRSRAIQELHNDFLDVVSDWLWEMDAEFRFTFLTGQVEQVTGFPPEHFLGKSRKARAAAMSPEGARHLADLEARRPFRNFTYRFQHASGHDIWLSLSGKPRFDAQGAFIGYRGCGGEVTDLVRADEARRHAEEALRNANEVLEERVSERTAELEAMTEDLRAARDAALAASAAKSQFLATMSHELRTPLNGMIGMTELLLNSALNEKQTKFAQVALDSARSLLSMINDILDLMHLDTGRIKLVPEPFDLRAVVDTVARTYWPAADEQGVALDVETAEDFPERVVGDGTRLRQIAINLVSNAVKFTRKGSVTVRLVPEGPNEILLSVADTGTGMDKATCARIFEAFTQGETGNARRFGGAGLGLTITARLVAMMGGVISVESAPGEGSTFYVRLPLQAVLSPTARAAREGGTDAEVRRVLIAEDNAVNQIVITEHLKRMGITPTVVADGRIALETVSAEPFDLILMDVQMPEMDGMEATRAIRATEKAAGAARTPIIGLTAHADDAYRRDCMKAGMDDVITKPFTASDIRRVLKTYAPAARVA